jgi:hypothetical protein
VKATELLLGWLFGTVFPKRDVPPRHKLGSARKAALDVLRLYVAELTFYREGDKDGDEPIPFTVPLANVFVEQPDNDVDMALPSVVFVQEGNEEYQSQGFVPRLDLSSRDRYGVGTALEVEHEHVELIGIEIWTSKKPERDAILAGLQAALVPSDEFYGVRFRLPDYFDRVAIFTPESSQRLEDQTIRGRRVSRMRVELRVESVRLVPVERLIPVVSLRVEHER